MIASTPSFVVRQECEKAAFQNGYRRQLVSSSGWLAFASTTVPGSIYLTAEGDKGPWHLALDHVGVIDELTFSACSIPGPGSARYAFSRLGDLYEVLSRVYQLSRSLPDAPLLEFQTKTERLPNTTETEQLVVQRIGQDIFRRVLTDYWQGQCPLTGIADTELLRASHIIPWSKCSSDKDRLDAHNGLLLSALWDAAFDRGLVTFEDDGHPFFSPALSNKAIAELRWQQPVALTDRHRDRLAWHRANLFKGTP